MPLTSGPRRFELRNSKTPALAPLRSATLQPALLWGSRCTLEKQATPDRSTSGSTSPTGLRAKRYEFGLDLEPDRLMLYKGGYEVGRFISIEKLMKRSKETYYDALASSTVGWHECEHDLQPWLYFLGVLTAAYPRVRTARRSAHKWPRLQG